MNNSVNNFKCSFNKYFLNLIRKENWGHRNKSFNSSEWLKRRNADIYYEKAKKENYRLA